MTARERYIHRFNTSDIAQKVSALRLMIERGRLHNSYRNLMGSIYDMIDVLDQLYNENWDLILVKNERTPEYTVPFDLDIVVRYPEILITNSRNESHIIRDLYIRLVPRNRNGRFTIYDFEGKRMTVDANEYRSSYKHSHQSGRNYDTFYTEQDYSDYYEKNKSNSAHSYQGFCKGSSEINQVLTMLGAGFTKEKFKLFLLQLDEYVNWESIEGTPYKYIRDLTSDRELVSLSQEAIEGYVTRLKEMRDLLPRKVDFKIENGYPTIVDNDKLENFIKSYDNPGAYSSVVLARKTIKGEYRSYTTIVDPANLEERILDATSFYFRGEKQVFKVVPATTNLTTEFYIHKQIKEYVIEQFNKKIQERATRGYLSKQLNTIAHTQEEPRPNSLFVPKD